MEDINIPPNINIVIEHGRTSKFNNSLTIHYIDIFNTKYIFSAEYSTGEYIRNTTIKAVDVIKKEIDSLYKYEILAFEVPSNTGQIRFVMKLTEEEDKYIILILTFKSITINGHLFISRILNLEEFRYYGSDGLYGFYMKDEVIKYGFELLPTDTFLTNVMDLQPTLRDEQDSRNYLVIKNSLGDPVIMACLATSKEIDIFSKGLTEADPQAGLLFSLSYNANK